MQGGAWCLWVIVTLCLLDIKSHAKMWQKIKHCSAVFIIHRKKNTKDALFDAIGSADMNSVVYCFPCCIGLLCYILVLFSVRVHNSCRSVRIKSQCPISKKTSILRL